MPPTDHYEKAKRHERATFERFAASARLTIVAGTLQQPADPAPDILAELTSAGLVAFELGRLNPPLDAHQLALMDSVTSILETELRNLAPTDQDRVAAFLEDGRIVVWPRPGFPNRDLRRAAAWVITQLLTLPWEFEGPLKVSHSDARDVLESVNVLRLEAAKLPDQSHFSVITAGYSARGDLSVLERKLQTQYVSAAPIELLAYFDRGEFAFSGEIDEAVAVIDRLAPASVFSAVWLFEGLLHKATLAYRRAAE
jgi:hypothetical protein